MPDQPDLPATGEMDLAELEEALAADPPLAKAVSPLPEAVSPLAEADPPLAKAAAKPVEAPAGAAAKPPAKVPAEAAASALLTRALATPVAEMPVSPSPSVADVDPPPPVKGKPVPLFDRLLPPPYRQPVLVTLAVSLVLSVGFLFLPLAGTDLSAQVARGHFFREHGFVPVDLRWYGGVYPFGYSAFTGPLNALLGSRGVGATSCVISAVAFAWLLARVGARRPTLGGVLGAIVGVFNLVSGRTTFALGIAFGMLALCALVLPRVPERWRLGLAGLLAALSSAGSPVAGVFTGICGTALLLAGRRKEGAALCIGAGLALVPPALLFRDGGEQPFEEGSMKVTVAVCVAAFFLFPKEQKALRIGAVIIGLSTAGSFYFESPVGSNIIRLPILFAAPIAVAVSSLDKRWLAGVIAAICWWQPPLVADDLAYAGERAAQRWFHQPLIDELNRRRPIGRVEVVPLRDHWEATFIADAVPIARGWLRQVDVERNAIFYNGSLTPRTYLNWLYHNAVDYVATPRPGSGTKLDFGGREEASLIEANLPYLQRVWESGDWQLYKVVGSRPLVDRPGALIESGPTKVRFDVPVATDLTVRVRWSRWLVLKGPDGCIEPGDDDWVGVRLKRAGEYTLTSELWIPQRSAC
jgi:MFS family permease